MPLSGRKLFFRTRSWTHPQRVVLLALIGANVAVFVTQLFLEAYDQGFVRDYLGISDRGVRDAYTWQFVSAIFLHNGPWHFLANMTALYLLGRDVELILGQRHFFYLYLFGAIGGELGHLFLMPSDSVLLAASGGVAAVIVAYGTILPELELSASAFFFVPIRIKAKHLAYSAFALGLVLICVSRTGAIGHSALLGGCAAGWLYANLLGFGRPSFVQRMINRRRAETLRYQQMSPAQLMAQEIDPLLEKISRRGVRGLTRAEQRRLLKARETILEKNNLG
ncbi:MAG: rhomboid family intramembrane serine protease [Verrucomicrobiota bacterium]